uniref:Uncharacterized protein n=1 Tax=Romanomermis culicivorax TaxID=13658 RepID=A0A915HPX7_ROMCU
MDTPADRGYGSDDLNTNPDRHNQTHSIGKEQSVPPKGKRQKLFGCLQLETQCNAKSNAEKKTD